MALTDLPKWLVQRGSKVKGIKFYGTVMGAVQPPSPYDTLKISSPNTSFVVIDTVAFEHDGKFYWTKGKVMALLPDFILREAMEKPTKRLAVAVSGGRLEHSHKNIVMMYLFRMVDGAFTVSKSFAEKLTIANHKEVLQVIASGAKNGWKEYTYPVEDDMEIQPASDNYPFEFLGEWAEWVNNPPTITQTNVPQPQPVQNENMANNGTYENPMTHGAPPNLGLEPSSESSSNQSRGGILGGITSNSVIPFKPTKKSTLMRVDPTKEKPDYQRLEPEQYSEIMEEYKKTYYDSLDRVSQVLQDATEFEAPYDLFEILREGIASGLQKNASRSILGKSPRKLILDIMVALLAEEEAEAVAEGVSKEDSVDLTPKQIQQDLEMYEYDILGAISDHYNNSCITAKGIHARRDNFMFRLLEQLLDVRKGGLQGLYSIRGWGNASPTAILANNLYIAGLYQPTLAVESLDKLRMLMGLELTPEMSKVRNALKVHTWLIDVNNQSLDSSTMHPKKVLMNGLKAGFTLTTAKYEKVFQLTGNVIPDENLQAIANIFGEGIEGHEFQLPKQGWVRDQRNWTFTDGCSTEQLIKDAVEVGVLTEVQSPETGETLYADTAIMKKEVYIYDKLYGMLENQAVDVTQEEIDTMVDEFQKVKDEEFGLAQGTFQLEERQREALTLLQYTVGILTGGAGSGKTTTAELLLYGIIKKLKIDEESIFFAAPTGKASQRLSEVVKRMAYTLHRLFGLGTGSHYSLTSKHYEKPLEKIKILLIDETSIADTDLMYEVMLRVPEDAILYFLGDEDQLPPIGFGKPLASMLTFLPTIHLNVSKRAAEGSKITVNANRLINPKDTRELEEDDSFKIIQEKDANVGLALLKLIIQYHIAEPGTNLHLAENFKPVTTVGQGLTAKDIQIISPYSGSKTCAFTSKIVNSLVQEIFNPLAKHNEVISFNPTTYDKNPTQFRKGDRVIHVNSNVALRSRFKHTGGTTFKRVKSSGVYNGDVGTVKGFIPITELTLDYSDIDTETITEEDDRIIRAVSRAQNTADGNIFQEVTPTYYMAVEYDGVNNNGELEQYIVLYQYKELSRDGKITYILPLELTNVELAYCLSTHKLQGSQADLVIFLLFPHGRLNSKPFISRNMLYTGVTRAKKAEYVLGDIYGENSIVNHGRKYQANTTRKTVYDYI